MAIVEAIDIVFRNIDAFIDNIDIDNTLLQNFLYKPPISANYLDLKKFKSD